MNDSYTYDLFHWIGFFNMNRYFHRHMDLEFKRDVEY